MEFSWVRARWWNNLEEYFRDFTLHFHYAIYVMCCSNNTARNSIIFVVAQKALALKNLAVQTKVRWPGIYIYM